MGQRNTSPENSRGYMIDPSANTFVMTSTPLFQPNDSGSVNSPANMA